MIIIQAKQTGFSLKFKLKEYLTNNSSPTQNDFLSVLLEKK